MGAVAKTGTGAFDPSAGQFIRCMPVDGRTTHIQVQFKQLRVVTHDPVALQPGNARLRPSDVTEEDVELHAEVQRGIEHGKKSNIPSYAEYILRHVTGEQVGVLPPMHLWTERELSIHQFPDQDGVVQHFLCVPHGLNLIAIDGETQLASHYHLQQDPTLPQEVKERHAAAQLSAVVHDARPALEARKFFYDLNVLGVKVNTTIALAMDTTDPLMGIVGRLSEDVPFFRGKVERISRQIKKNSLKVIKVQDLRQVVVNMVHGIAGVQYGAKPAPVDKVALDELETVAREWLTAYTEAFGAELTDRETCVAGTGTVLAAVGALGQSLLDAPAEERSGRRDALIASLAQIDWRKGDHWLGTVLTQTPKGNYTINGPKQSAYAVHAALSHEDTTAYRRVRHQPEPTSASEEPAGEPAA
ncbi:DNA sulfur modification protein DndB [Streptomyces sp. N35]|uniref:DNA sulfur modification protein DndB n=1 Tax=Streptomyces sp. N35 TaxID=2795730 RepID=UPI0018F62772|nr:DNA sulfur modification protein DndB [Streptomyces sp. N35]